MNIEIASVILEICIVAEPLTISGPGLTLVLNVRRLPFYLIVK